MGSFGTLVPTGVENWKDDAYVLAFYIKAHKIGFPVIFAEEKTNGSIYRAIVKVTQLTVATELIAEPLVGRM